MEEESPNPPFGGSIGLSLSGGGYRAAAFHLGALSYLARRGLDDQLQGLSTVSGGTFAGAQYVLSRVERQPFGAFFLGFYTALQTTDLVADGLQTLAARRNGIPSGRQDLIVSMAQVYDETFFCKPNDSGLHQPYYFRDVLHGNCGIQHVIFNATDFRSGLAFRFQRSADGKATIGNFYNNISTEDASKIRLADIVAASSCFPGGFEPLSFPYDFTWQGGEIPATVQQVFPVKREGGDTAHPQGPVALMDGGVFDNQGLQSLLLAENHNQENFDLVIISDVDQPSLDLYTMPKPGPLGGPSLGTLRWLGLIAFILFMVTTVSLGYHALLDFRQSDLDLIKLIFLYLIPAGLSVSAAYVIYLLREIIRDDVLCHIPVLGARAWKSISHLSLGQVRNMIKLRVTSVLTLSVSVFMKRIRGLVYQNFYENRSQAFEGKRISNLIYTLAPSKTRTMPVKGLAPPSPFLQKVACLSFNMDTTLWFTEQWQAPCLTASGQAALCYNLIKLIAQRFGEDPLAYTTPVRAEYDQLVADWQAFNTDPFFQLKANGVKEDWPAIENMVLAADGDWGMFAAI